ncbi:MAG: OmpA family protein, partial [Muribaculaceae bacterium]|nr:OmpA family protein [Muribaculaceae bacterium]
EVIVITIPASQLFDPNETTLTNLGIMSIKPLLKYLKTKGLYKMLLVMHSDNTGTDKYTVELTRHRVDAVYDWIEANASVDFVVPYALGASDPIMPNNSVDNRRANRRLEVYLVPDAAMVEMAKKGAPRL